MLISPSASTVAPALQHSHGTRSTAKQDLNTGPVEESSKVTLSSEALRHAAEVAEQPKNTTSPYRITGSSFKVGVSSAFAMPEALAKEMAIRTEEEKLREEINARYAYEHQYQTVGQVLVDGKFFAEVNEAGGYGLIRDMPGLSENSLSPRERVEEIARALKGKGTVEIRYSNFVPGLGGWSGPSAPESMLPPFTARSHQEIFQEALDMMARMRTEASPSAESAASALFRS
ncbi:MAG TPA: hypothetical protein VEC35_11130 [Noviherbaspirillum sp.]|nr:hypothetical protein [Noviherbaspirillum sp.]